MDGLTLVNLYKSFPIAAIQRGSAPRAQALQGVSFNTPLSHVTAVVGPSGCGKSTLLNIIAGLEVPDQGEVLWNGVSIGETAPYQRGFGLMFQDFALFPHKNIFDNIAFGLQMQGQPPAGQRKRVEEVLQLVGLPGFEKRDINRLSGGEQQRVALARALAPRPRLLMLDEPLGSLDRLLRERLVDDLRRILRHSQQTALYVTHDQEEAFALADQVVVMNSGRVEQIGAPAVIYRQPASLFVAQFMGMGNLLPAQLQPGPSGESWQVETSLGRWAVPQPDPGVQPGACTLLIRPNAAEPGWRQPVQLAGSIIQRSFRGRDCRMIVEIGQQRLTFESSCTDEIPAEGQAYQFSLDPAQAFQIFPAGSPRVDG